MIWHIKRTRGYTLVEMLFYIALFAIISVFVINALITTSRAFAIARATRALNTSAEGAMERMAREIRLADAIDVASVFNATPGTLKMTSIDAATGNPQTMTFSLASGIVQLQKGAGTVQDITSGTVSVSSLIFRQIVGSSSPAVKIEMIINGVPFYDTALLRRAY